MDYEWMDGCRFKAMQREERKNKEKVCVNGTFDMQFRQYKMDNNKYIFFRIINYCNTRN